MELKTNSCDGKAIKLKMSQIDEVIIQANNQLGGFGGCLQRRTRKLSMYVL